MMRTAIRAGALGAIMAAAMGGLPANANADDDIWHRDTLTGDWGGARTALHDHGIDIAPTYIGEALGNVSGGLRRGGVYEGRADLSLDADLDKLMGWTGGLFHATGYQIQRTRGGIGGSFTGSLSPPSNIEARPATRLFTLWLQQSFLADKLSLRVGQLAADDEFLVSPTAGNLINGTFGWADIMSANLPSGGPAYPLAAPGARLQVNPTPDVSILAAVFSGDPAGQGCTDDPQACNNHGTTFSFSGGTFWIAEAQYRINQGDHAAGLPGVYKLGAWYHNGRFADIAGGPETHAGDRGLYAVADQTLWRNADKSRSLNGFLRVGAAPSNRNLVSFYVDGGLGYTGLIPGRGQDTLTLGVAYAKISDDAADHDQQTLIELNYRARVTPWLTVQPDIQYIVHPGGLVPNPNDPSGGTTKDALVLGIRTTIAF
jgi:porin